MATEVVTHKERFVRGACQPFDLTDLMFVGTGQESESYLSFFTGSYV